MPSRWLETTARAGRRWGQRETPLVGQPGYAMERPPPSAVPGPPQSAWRGWHLFRALDCGHAGISSVGRGQVRASRDPGPKAAAGSGRAGTMAGGRGRTDRWQQRSALALVRRFGGLLLVLAGVWVVLAGPLHHRMWLVTFRSGHAGPRELPRAPRVTRAAARTTAPRHWEALAPTHVTPQEDSERAAERASRDMGLWPDASEAAALGAAASSRRSIR